jgi:hypothetical protein
LNSPPTLLLFIPPPPIPGIASTVITFCIYIHVYTVFTLYSPSYTLFHHTTPPTCTYASTMGRTCSDPLFSDFVEVHRKNLKKKKLHFFFFKMKIATQGVSL